jgi:hypothetical protein
VSFAYLRLAYFSCEVRSEVAWLREAGMTEKLDNLDQALLADIDRYGGQKTSISDVIRPFLELKSDNALRARVKKLRGLGLIGIWKYPGCALVKITKKGHDAAQSVKE